MTELHSVVCSEWHTDNDVQEIYHCSVYKLTHENVNTTTGRDGPTLSGPARPGPMRLRICTGTWRVTNWIIIIIIISARTRPGPLKFVNFRPKPGPCGPGRAGPKGPPGPCRALIGCNRVQPRNYYDNTKRRRFPAYAKFHESSILIVYRWRRKAKDLVIMGPSMQLHFTL